jgi:AcrR family transcriptional regulator
MPSAAAVKRRDPVRTRARILAAAAETFAEFGYANAGLREIAERADVASSLLVRYFGTKPGLFEAALLETIRTNSVFTWEKRGFGETMVGLMQARNSNAITKMLIQAHADPNSRRVADRVWNEHVIAPLAEWLGEPDAVGRARNLYALMVGFTLLEGITDMSNSPDALAWQAAALQAIVDNTGPGAPAPV